MKNRPEKIIEIYGTVAAIIIIITVLTVAGMTVTGFYEGLGLNTGSIQ